VKIRDSGMPEETYWESLFDVPLILDRLVVDHNIKNIVELGCGYGTFTLPIATRISGTLTTFDIEEALVARTRDRAKRAGLANVVCQVVDIVRDGFPVPSASQDACLLFNILHAEDPTSLLSEAARILRPDGVVLAIHWRHDPSTPRGPALDIRPRPDHITAWAKATGHLNPAGPNIDLPPWHFGLRFSRIK
jgi:SAM-dependent methyltransferase